MARSIADEPSEDVVANARKERAAKRGPFGRVAVFLRQVIAELKKVVTPTRRELINYSGVLLVFVLFMMGFVAGLDWAFSALINFVFGNPDIAG